MASRTNNKAELSKLLTSMNKALTEHLQHTEWAHDSVPRVLPYDIARALELSWSNWHRARRRGLTVTPPRELALLGWHHLKYWELKGEPLTEDERHPDGYPPRYLWKNQPPEFVREPQG